VRTFIEEELTALGCQITCMGDGTHAIRALRIAAANKSPYNLLLLDYHVRRRTSLIFFAAAISSPLAHSHAGWLVGVNS
jgi:CheY-like chemotaxis protein